MSDTTKAAVLQGDGSTPIQEVPLPPLAKGDLLVKLIACGVCTGEAMRWYTAGKSSAVLGHEIVAEVIGGGDGLSFRPGDRVFPHHHAPCGVCEACLRGLESSCAVWKKSHLSPGGYAETFVVPAHNATADTWKIPAAISDEVATMVEPVACVVRALHKAQGTRPSLSEPNLLPRPHARGAQRILLIGLGFMAQLGVLLFKHRFSGARLVATEPMAERRAQGLSLGLSKVIDPTELGLAEAVTGALGGLPDLVVVFPSSPLAVKQGLDLLDVGGRLVLFAPPPPDRAVPVDFNRLYFREAEILSAYSCGPADVAESLLWCEKLKDDLATLVSHRWPMSRVGEALAAIADQDPSVRKIVVRP